MIRELIQKIAVRKDIIETMVEQEEFWNIQRKISPSLVQEKKDHIVIDNTIYARCRIIGVPSF